MAEPRQYQVRWEIDIEADTPQEAAEEALHIQRDADSIATVFDVTDAETGETTNVDVNPGDKLTKVQPMKAPLSPEQEQEWEHEYGYRGKVK